MLGAAISPDSPCASSLVSIVDDDPGLSHRPHEIVFSLPRAASTELSLSTAFRLHDRQVGRGPVRRTRSAPSSRGRGGESHDPGNGTALVPEPLAEQQNAPRATPRMREGAKVKKMGREYMEKGKK